MSSQYFAILTEYGTQAFAKALSSKQPLQLTTFAVGDGNGQAVTPTANRTALVRETHRANVSAVTLDPRNNKQVIVELTIPENVGGFYIREMGVFDNQNKLVAYANSPESYKPKETSGSGKVQVLRMILKIASSDAVTLSIDNSVIFVTRQQLAPKTISATTQNGFDETGHTHEITRASTTQAGITQLSSELNSNDDTKAATPKAIKELKTEIAQVSSDQQNYIPNSKKSSATNSNSNDTVATSSAVKSAYDKAVTAQTSADNAQRTANDGVSRANQAQQSANQANNNANNRVSKSGDTMTGPLTVPNVIVNDPANNNNSLQVGDDSKFIDVDIAHTVGLQGISDPKQGYIAFGTSKTKFGYTGTNFLIESGIASRHFGHGSYGQQYTSGAPFIVDATGSKDRDTYHPFVKGLVRSKNHYGAAFSFGYTTKQGAGDGFGKGAIVLNKDTGEAVNWGFEHNGDFVSPGDVRTSNGKSVNKSVQNDELVGEISFFARSTPPSGWLKANGAAVSRTTYAALFAAIGTTFGAGDGRTTFNLPDLRGEFVRGLDDGRNVDNGRRLGSVQGDAIRNITGQFWAEFNGYKYVVTTSSNGVFSLTDNSQSRDTFKGDVANYGATNKKVEFNASRVVPTANENRPRNIALLACIKY